MRSKKEDDEVIFSQQKFASQRIRCEKRAFARAALTVPSSKHRTVSTRNTARFTTYVYPLRKDFAIAAIFSALYVQGVKKRGTRPRF